MGELLPDFLLQFNDSAIIDAVINAKRGDGSDEKISSIAAESALELVQAWHEKYSEKDANTPIIAVECPFFIWLDQNTIVLGMMDRIQLAPSDLGGIQGCEWKTHKAPTKKQYGEENWLEEIANGPQLATYALALKAGYLRDSSGVYIGYNGPVSILTRAAVKSSPPSFWPSIPGYSTFLFTDEHVQSISNSLLNRATIIRELRRVGRIPWQFVGGHCYRQYGRTCEFLEKYCLTHNHPSGMISPGSKLSPGDPGSAALEAGLDWRSEHWGLRENSDAELVVLSASTYQLSTVCLEKHRIVTSGGPGETSTELEIGTGFHAGIAEIGRQIMEIQRRGR